MAIYTELDIFDATRDLTLLIERYVGKMKRNYRATLGADLRRDCRRIVRRIYQANAAVGHGKSRDEALAASKQRIKAIGRMRVHVEMINLALYEARELEEISKGEYARGVELTQRIGKQASGWLNSSESALVSLSSRH